jgi:hypothetical protein
MARDLEIVRKGSGFNLYVNGVPVVRDPKDGKITFDRQKAGVAKKGKSKKSEAIPESWPPMLFQSAEDVQHIAHMIGRYIFQLGDFVSGYVYVTGVADLAEFWKDIGIFYDRAHGLKSVVQH